MKSLVKYTEEYVMWWEKNDFVRNFHKLAKRGFGLVWFGFFVYWHINLCWLFNAKAILLEEQLW